MVLTLPELFERDGLVRVEGVLAADQVGAMRDRLHEDVRLALVPEVRELFDRLREAGLAVCVSGSGPTLLAFERDDAATPEPGEGWTVLRVPVRASGVDIREG